MRTTISIDPDNSREIKRLVKKDPSARAFKRIVNSLLRLGLKQLKALESQDKYQVEVVDIEFLPGQDLQRLSRIANELEVEQERAKAHE